MEENGAKPVKESEDARYSYLWIFWGIILALLKLAYTFFPFFYILDVILFVLAGGFIQRRYVIRKKERMLYAVLPSLILILYILFQLGKENILNGIGTGWLISFFLIPLSLLLGGYLQRRYKESYL